PVAVERGARGGPGGGARAVGGGGGGGGVVGAVPLHDPRPGGGGQAIGVRGGVHIGVVDGQEAGDGLLLEPLAHVALGGAGAGGELTGRRLPAVGECLVEAEPTTEVDRRDLQGVDGGGEQALHQRVGRDTRRRAGSADLGHR